MESIWLGGGVGWGGIIASMYACGTSWCYVDGMLPKAWWWSPWSASVVNGLGRCECGEERKLQESNNLIVAGNISRKIAPVKWRTALGPTINARFWDRIYEWIYRHNMSKWDIASRCEMKKSLCKLFVVSWRNCWFEKWQNVRRFDTLMSKTHGCVNPRYHVFGHKFLQHDFCSDVYLLVLFTRNVIATPSQTLFRSSGIVMGHPKN